MKIDSTTPTAGAVSGSNEPRSRGSASAPLPSAATEVHLSELAAQLQSSGEAPAFDATRVSEITQAIAEGRFTINADTIADRLIASASELIASQPKA